MLTYLRKFPPSVSNPPHLKVPLEMVHGLIPVQPTLSRAIPSLVGTSIRKSYDSYDNCGIPSVGVDFSPQNGTDHPRSRTDTNAVAVETTISCTPLQSTSCPVGTGTRSLPRWVFPTRPYLLDPRLINNPGMVRSPSVDVGCISALPHRGLLGVLILLTLPPLQLANVV